MSTGLRDVGTAQVSAEEAEAIFELWARRQAETESLRSRLTVDDIAESMSIPPSEVELMLQLVRSLPRTSPREMRQEKRKKRRSKWLIVLASLFWLCVLAGAFAGTWTAGFKSASSGYESWQNQGLHLNEGSSYLIDKSGRYVDSHGNLGAYLPAGMTIEFQGYVQEGVSKAGGLTEENYLYAFANLVERLDIRNPRYYSYVGVSQDELAQQLRTGKLAKGVENHIKFEEMKVKYQGKEVLVKIPVVLDNDTYSQDVVRTEITRRLRIFANQAWRLSK